MAVLERGVLHFTVTGESMTHMARELMLGDDERHALALLVDGLQGMSRDLAQRILRGEAALDGIDGEPGSPGLRLVEAVNVDYQKQLAYIYAGRVQIPDGRGRRSWYRPCAEVKKDESFFLERAFCFRRERVTASTTASANRRYLKELPCLLEDEVCFEVGPTFDWRVIVFEPCAPPPSWDLQRRTDITAAVQEAEAAGRRFDLRELPPSARRMMVEVERITGARTEAQQAAREEEEKQREKEFRRRLEEWRLAIVAQAGEDWLELAVEGRALRIPRAPLLNWILHRKHRELMLPWTTVCPSGLRLNLDDEYHSDWIVGAGLFDVVGLYRGDPEELLGPHGRISAGIYQAAYEEAEKLIAQAPKDPNRHRLIHYSGTGDATGVALHPVLGEEVPPRSILILPDLRQSWYPQAVHASAVIAEVGGQTAHLAQVLLEADTIVAVLPEARTKIPVGTRVHVQPHEVTILEGKEDLP